MKILFIHHGAALGGAPLSLLYLVRELERINGIDLGIVCHSREMRDFFIEHLKHTSVEPWPDSLTLLGKVFTGWASFRIVLRNDFRLALSRMRDSIRRQEERLRALAPDIVHLNSSVLFTSALAARRAKIPLVWHDRECLQGGAWNLRRRLCGHAIRSLADAVIAISPAEARRLGRDSRRNVSVVYNPVPPEVFDPARYDSRAERQRWGVAPSEKLLVSLGGCNPRKGTLETVEAMRFLDPGARLIIAGPEPAANPPQDTYAGRIQTVIASLPQGQVRFIGQTEEIASLLSACDALIFAGMTPHFPRPVLEAWTMEKPVVVFEMDGISTLVEHDVDGVVVAERTGRALGHATRNLLANAAQCRSFGKNGRAKAEKLCLPAICAQGVLAVYHELLSQA